MEHQNRSDNHSNSLCIVMGMALLFISCQGVPDHKKINNATIGKVTEKMTDIMVHDVTNPPLAARFYAYACLAGYEVAAMQEGGPPSFSDLLNEFPKLVKPQLELPESYYPVSAVLSMMATSSAMQPSGSRMKELEEAFLDSCMNWGYTQSGLDKAMEFANQVSAQILEYAKNDKYREISNYPRYQPESGDGFWYPTPPGYFTPVEPYFNTIRPFILDRADQFKPDPPAEFSELPSSPFFEMMNEVYKVELNTEHREIAAFWDCNPFALEETGHLMVGIKQISPGGHWMGITDIACKKTGLDFGRTLEINTLVAIGLMDGFISCWDEKYRSNRIRPETAIRKFLDPSYRPLLQTPPFPEYLSGHSTISTASAVILTHFFGQQFPYTDTVEEKYGLGTRDFNSFLHASEEASISRLYGGIHFIDAIVKGQEQGTKVGNLVLDKYQKHLQGQENRLVHGP
jgi:hypothetical protein